VFSIPTDRRFWIKIRVGLLVIALFVGAVTVAWGAWDLGVTRKAELTLLAKEQYTRQIKLSARRGMLLDRRGDELAVEVEVDSVYADPRLIKTPQAAAKYLCLILGKDEKMLLGRLTSKKHFVWLKRRISPEVAAKVKDLNLDGVSMIKESKRFYPNKSLAAHVIGFAGIDSRGLEGIERKFDEQLLRKQEVATGLSDAHGRMVFSKGAFESSGIMGSNIKLTIDRRLQYIVEHELASAVRIFEAKAGHITMMDPRTGEILALANWPTYNLNRIDKSTADQRRNRAVLDVFEPGSTFKVFTLSAALNSGKLRPDEKIFCEHGLMKIHDVVIHDDHRDGWLNPTQCLKRSSNICFAKIAERVGKKRLYHYLRRFGFGDRTHVQLPFEMRGTLAHYKKWRDIDTATTAFGQGVGVTGLQMVSALGAIANGGVLMKPRLVKKIIGSNGETEREFTPKSRRRVISRYTARMLGDMMTAVTEEGGTGTQGSLDGFLVAGKTGTAQKSVGSRGYHKDKWIASFFGFVPADDPKLVISVVIDEPMINHYGGTVAAPVLRRIADQSMRYLGIAPRFAKQQKRKKTKTIDDKDKVMAETMDMGIEDHLDVPKALIGEGQVATPNLIGISMTTALQALSDHGLRPLFMGSGLAIEQAPPPGAPVDDGEFVQVNFHPVPETVDSKRSNENNK